MEKLIASYTTGYDTDRFIASDRGIKKAQQFTLPKDCSPTRIRLMLKHHPSAGTSTNIVLRIETDDGIGDGLPTGTLVNSLSKRVMNRFEDTSYAFRDFYFLPGVLTLTKNTKYWLVLQHENELINNSVYAWQGDSTSPTYTNGISAAMETFGTWIADSSVDFLFEIYIDEPGVETQKVFSYKVYDSNNNFLKTWTDATNTPSFNWGLNRGMGEITINLAREINDFGESEDVKPGNIVELWIRDGDNRDGIREFTGIISAYEPVKIETGVEYVKVTVASTSTTLKDTLVKDGSATTVTYSSQEISNILKDLITKYAGRITYTDHTINATGQSAGYMFKFMDYMEALEVIRALAPAYWFWYIDGSDLLYFKKIDFDTVNHTFFLGKQVQVLEGTKKEIGSLYNVVYFLGGGDPNLYIKTERTSSISEYGRREVRIKDERVTVAATAQSISNSFLDENDHIKSSVQITVLDNSIDNTKGYDIESIRPGDVVQVVEPSKTVDTTKWYNDAETEGNMEWDISFWDFDILTAFGQPMVVREIQYDFYSAKLKLSDDQDDIFDEVRNVQEDLNNTASINIPTTPS